jgi:hypothetical protein
MIFILIRALPIFLPVLYFILTESVLYSEIAWTWPLLSVGLLNIVYFALITVRQKNREALFFLVHSLIFLIVGFAYFLVLSNEILINLFVFIWSLVYFIYLESIFHYFYETKKVLVLNLKNIISYINLAVLFCLLVVLLTLYVFIGLSGVTIVLTSWFVVFILSLSRFKASAVDAKKIWIYSFVVSLLTIEMLIVILFLSISFFVSSLIVSVFYYTFSALSALSLKGELTKVTIMQYIAFTVVVLAVITLTSQWV